ncbi:MAG: hypothetical protein HY694_03435 [Deltaproteobacteria bacterium]|nr:hypothetical protein [Deltaproteobacteria bacterium]
MGSVEMSGATFVLPRGNDFPDTLSLVGSLGPINIADDEMAPRRPLASKGTFTQGYHRPATIELGYFDITGLSASATATANIVLWEERPNGRGELGGEVDLAYRSLSPRPAFSMAVQYRFVGRKKPMLYPLDDEEMNGLLELE